MKIIVCPHCKKPFKLDAQHIETLQYSNAWYDQVVKLCANNYRAGEDTDINYLWESFRTDILRGKLICELCRIDYPIENGIPKILPKEMCTLSGKMGRGDPKNDIRLEQFMDEIGPVSAINDVDLFIQIQMANQSNYGFEWKVFSHEYEGWERVYKQYYVSESDTYFEGKIGLDAGCGMGRYTLVSASKGAEMIGLDLSNAIEIAYAKSRDTPFLHAVQGDIYNLPFRENYFDFAQTLGVIHITPDPEQALLSIKRVVQPNKKIFVYVYPNFKDENIFKYYLLRVVNQVRRITVKLPSNLLYWLLYLMVPVVLFLFYWPSWLLWLLPGMRRFSKIMPYSYEQYRGRRIRDIHMNLFDRFGNPVERRYSRDEMEAWMQRTGFREYTLSFRDGWIVSAVK